MESEPKYNVDANVNASGGNESNAHINNKSVALQAEHMNRQSLVELMPDVVHLLNNYESLVKKTNRKKQLDLNERLGTAIRTALVSYIRSIWDTSQEKTLFMSQSESYASLLSENRLTRHKLLNLFELIEQIDNISGSDGYQNTTVTRKRKTPSSSSIVTALQLKVNQLKNELAVVRKHNVIGVKDVLKVVTDQRNEYEQMLKQLDTMQDPVTRADLTKRIDHYLRFEQMLLQNLRTGMSDRFVSRDNVKRIIDELDSLADNQLRKSFYFKHIYHILTSMGQLNLVSSSLSSSATAETEKNQAGKNMGSDYTRTITEKEYNDRVHLLVNDIVRVSNKLKVFRLDDHDNQDNVDNSNKATAAVATAAATIAVATQYDSGIETSTSTGSPPVRITVDDSDSDRAKNSTLVIRDKLPTRAERTATVAGVKRKQLTSSTESSSSPILRKLLKSSNDNARKQRHLSPSHLKILPTLQQSTPTDQSDTVVVDSNNSSSQTRTSDSKTIQKFFQNFVPDKIVDRIAFSEQRQQPSASPVGDNDDGGGGISVVLPQPSAAMTISYNDVLPSQSQIRSNLITSQIESHDNVAVAGASSSSITQDEFSIFDDLPSELLLPKQVEEQQTPEETQQSYLHIPQNTLSLPHQALPLNHSRSLSLGDEYTPQSFESISVFDYSDDIPITRFDDTLVKSTSYQSPHQKNDYVAADNSYTVENIGNCDMYSSIRLSNYAASLGRRDLFSDVQSNSSNFVVPTTTAFKEALRLRQSSHMYKKSPRTVVATTTAAYQHISAPKYTTQLPQQLPPLGNPPLDEFSDSDFDF